MNLTHALKVRQLAFALAAMLSPLMAGVSTAADSLEITSPATNAVVTIPAGQAETTVTMKSKIHYEAGSNHIYFAK